MKTYEVIVHSFKTLLFFHKKSTPLALLSLRGGVLRVFNFSNGAKLKELFSEDEDEVTAIAYVKGGFHNKHVVGAGWNRKVGMMRNRLL